MNKIEVVNDVIVKKNLDDAFTLVVDEGTEFLSVNQLKITVKKNATLKVFYHGTKPSKLNIVIEVQPNQKLRMEEIRFNQNVKVQYQYRILDGACVTVNRMSSSHHKRQWDLVYLNGKNAQFSLCESTIASKEQHNHVLIYHNASHTKSFLNFRGITVEEGKIQLSMTGIVEQGMNHCKLEQNAEIVGMNDQVSEIEPMYVVEEDKTVQAVTNTNIVNTMPQNVTMRQFLMGNVTFTKEFQHKIEKEIKELEVSYES